MAESVYARHYATCQTDTKFVEGQLVARCGRFAAIMTIKRRDFLRSAAIPVAAAMAPSVLSAQAGQTSGAAAPARIRVGVVGAGGIVTSTHIPGLRRMPGVEIVAVANRSLESSRRAAAELKIPRA